MVNTASLQTAKALKEAGFRQDTHWHWDKILGDGKTYGLDTGYVGNGDYAAPTTDELLEELPFIIIIKIIIIKINYKLTIQKSDVGFWVEYFSDEMLESTKSVHHESLPEALAAMYLFLKKEGLI